MTADSGPRLSDFVVGVLDGVFALSFPGTDSSDLALRGSSKYPKGYATFLPASTVALRTAISHASVSTGRVPRDHGVMGPRRLRLDLSCPTAARLGPVDPRLEEPLEWWGY